jgi:ankyrin repeat protein
MEHGMIKRKKLDSDDLVKLYNIFVLNDFDKLNEFINEYGLDSVDKDGNNVFLHCVTDKTFYSLVKMMIEQIENININFQNKTGNSALHIAVKNKNMDLLELLLKNRNINVDIQDDNEKTPLEEALFLFDTKFDEDIIIKLLDSGANINKLDKHGYKLIEFINESMVRVSKYIKEHNIELA